MIVAIDGPAGSGKSTVAHAVAERRQLTYLDTGAMYRSVTLRCLREGVDLADEKAVAAVAAAARIEFSAGEKGQTVLLDGQDVTADIRTPEVDRNVSVVSAVPAVREVMVALQRAVADSGDVVAEGRDIGTVVFPSAEVKVFLTASDEARAHRRAVQREGGDAAKDASATADAAEEQQILDDIRRRDKLDSSRAESPLRAADDAHRIDSSDLTLDQVIDQVLALVDAAREGKAAEAKPEAEAVAKPADEAAAKPEAEAAAKPAKKERVSAAKAKPGEGHMRAFAGNSFEDYYDHGMRDYPLPARALLACVVCLVGAVTKILWPWKFEQGELMWEESRGRVLVMNHVSMLEPVVVVCSLWFHGQRVRPIYKSEFDKAGIVTWLFSRVGGIPIQRGSADLKAVRRAQRALQRGEVVLIYPEGTRIKTDEKAPIHGGFALIAQMGKAPVQPSAVVGARDITRPGRFFKKLGRVFLKVGPCIEFSELGVKGRKQQAQKMEQVAMDRVWELRDELRRDHPGKM
ncbi:(d)CMP kinase [Olsenella intestinalis]|uniref:(d)CMP kinase n=1 Tax=Olsenella intestinalis TaxID=2930083 RepID=UPI00200BF20F